MSGAALGMVTALALAAAAPQEPPGRWQDVRFGARRVAPAAQPLFQPTPPPAPRADEPRVICNMPVVHADTRVDARFVVPVPKVPAFTMRWAPSRPCDPSLGGGRDELRPAPQRRR
jgi:hypothetical protein